MNNSLLAIIIFSVLTLLYFVAKYYLTNITGDPNSSSSTYLKIISLLYYALILGSQVIINFNALKSICGNSNMGSALMVTIIPWVFIFGIMNVVLMMFPSWKSPFSNTFGYLATRLAGVRTLLLDDIHHF